MGEFVLTTKVTDKSTDTEKSTDANFFTLTLFYSWEKVEAGTLACLIVVKLRHYVSVWEYQSQVVNWVSSHIFYPNNCWVKGHGELILDLGMDFIVKVNIFAFFKCLILTSQILPQRNKFAETLSCANISKQSEPQTRQTKALLGQNSMNSLENRHINRI